MTDTAVRFDSVSIVFGETPQTALPLMDEGRSRAEIEQATGRSSACMTARSMWRRARSSC